MCVRIVTKLAVNTTPIGLGPKDDSHALARVRASALASQNTSDIASQMLHLVDIIGLANIVARQELERYRYVSIRTGYCC